MLDEDEIITHAALRLDGYACIERTGFDAEAASRRCLASRECDLATLEAMMVLFTLQRWLFKWGGEMLQRTHPDWWLCRECFLRTAREPTPPEHADDRYLDPWNERFVPRVDEAIGIVAATHAATEYLWPPQR